MSCCIRSFRGFAIDCREGREIASVRGKEWKEGGREGGRRTLRPLDRSSISRLCVCNSNICPETLERSCWNVERKLARESRSVVLDYENEG